MSIYGPGKLKRKDLDDDACDDFFDASLCPLAAKIRRLNVNLHMAMEEQGPFVPDAIEQPLLEEEMNSNMIDGASKVTEAVLPSTLNEERSLILYKVPDNQYGLPYKISPKLVSSIKKYGFMPGNPSMADVEEEFRENKQPSSSCLAVVPWSPSPVPLISQVVEMLAPGYGEQAEETMVAEGTAAMSMEIEEDDRPSGDVRPRFLAWLHDSASPSCSRSVIR